jgi:hypothetical protein
MKGLMATRRDRAGISNMKGEKGNNTHRANCEVSLKVTQVPRDYMKDRV